LRKYVKLTDIEKAIKESAGVIAIAQKKLEERGIKLSRKAMYSYINKSPLLQKVLEEEREKIKDRAELNLIKAIQDGDIKVSIEFLRRKAKERGWGDELALGGIDEKDLKIQVKIVEGNKKSKKEET